MGFDKRFTLDSKSITKAQNLIYKVNAHHKPFLKDEINDCGKCLRFIELAHGDSFRQNPFLDDNLRFNHDMPKWYMNGKSYKDANNEKQLYYRVKDEASKKRWDDIKKWWSDEKFFLNQDAS